MKQNRRCGRPTKARADEVVGPMGGASGLATSNSRADLHRWPQSASAGESIGASSDCPRSATRAIALRCAGRAMPPRLRCHRPRPPARHLSLRLGVHQHAGVRSWRRSAVGDRSPEAVRCWTPRWREMDSNLYGAFPVKRLFWVVLTVFCSERERPFFVPSPAIRFAERAEGVKGPKR